MVIGDEELERAEAALLEALEEIAPVDFGFAECDAEAEDGAFTIGSDAQSDEHGAIDHAAAVADFFIACIEEDVGECAEGPCAPEEQIGIEACGALADVGGTDGGAAEWRRLGHTFQRGRV